MALKYKVLHVIPDLAYHVGHAELEFLSGLEHLARKNMILEITKCIYKSANVHNASLTGSPHLLTL